MIFSTSFLFKDIIYLFQREGEHKQGERHAEEEGEAGSPLSKEPETLALIPGPWDHDLSRRQTFNQLSHPGAPKIFEFKLNTLQLTCSVLLVSGLECSDSSVADNTQCPSHQGPSLMPITPLPLPLTKPPQQPSVCSLSLGVSYGLSPSLFSSYFIFHPFPYILLFLKFHI